MLEPTKEPLKPISAAEKIASIGQTPPVSPEMNTCTSDQFQVKITEGERMNEGNNGMPCFFLHFLNICIQRHLYVKGRCSFCQIELLLLDLLFMCDWKGVLMIRL